MRDKLGNPIFVGDPVAVATHADSMAYLRVGRITRSNEDGSLVVVKIRSYSSRWKHVHRRPVDVVRVANSLRDPLP